MVLRVPTGLPICDIVMLPRKTDEASEQSVCGRQEARILEDRRADVRRHCRNPAGSIVDYL